MDEIAQAEAALAAAYAVLSHRAHVVPTAEFDECNAACTRSTRREAIRCLKRYIAREIYHLIQQLNPTDQSPRTA